MTKRGMVASCKEASHAELHTLFTRLEAGGGGGGGGCLFIKINLQTRLLIVTRLVNEA